MVSQQSSAPHRLLLSAPPVVVEADGSGETSTTTGSGESSHPFSGNDKDGSHRSGRLISLPFARKRGN